MSPGHGAVVRAAGIRVRGDSAQLRVTSSTDILSLISSGPVIKHLLCAGCSRSPCCLVVQIGFEDIIAKHVES